jgi:hypothetical protein
MLRERSSTRYRFTCRGCQRSWETEYDVVHVADGHGVDWDCYFRGGLRAAAPTARGVVCCARCGSGNVHVACVATSDTARIAPAEGPPTVPMTAV